MAVTYLIDTDWAIDYLHKQPQVIAALEILRPMGLGISVITVAELEIGVRRARDRHAAQEGLENFLAPLVLFEVTRPICALFAEWTVRLQQRGESLDHFDVLIAATALHHHLTLCTNNRRHFERLEGLSLHSLLAEQG